MSDTELIDEIQSPRQASGGGRLKKKKKKHIQMSDSDNNNDHDFTAAEEEQEASHHRRHKHKHRSSDSDSDDDKAYPVTEDSSFYNKVDTEQESRRDRKLAHKVKQKYARLVDDEACEVGSSDDDIRRENENQYEYDDFVTHDDEIVRSTTPTGLSHDDISGSDEDDDDDRRRSSKHTHKSSRRNKHHSRSRSRSRDRHSRSRSDRRHSRRSRSRSSSRSRSRSRSRSDSEEEDRTRRHTKKRFTPVPPSMRSTKTEASGGRPTKVSENGAPPDTPVINPLKATLQLSTGAVHPLKQTTLAPHPGMSSSSKKPIATTANGSLFSKFPPPSHSSGFTASKLVNTKKQMTLAPPLKKDDTSIKTTDAPPSPVASSKPKSKDKPVTATTTAESKNKNDDDKEKEDDRKQQQKSKAKQQQKQVEKEEEEQQQQEEEEDNSDNDDKDSNTMEEDEPKPKSSSSSSSSSSRSKSSSSTSSKKKKSKKAPPVKSARSGTKYKTGDKVIYAGTNYIVCYRGKEAPLLDSDTLAYDVRSATVEMYTTFQNQDTSPKTYEVFLYHCNVTPHLLTQHQAVSIEKSYSDKKGKELRLADAMRAENMKMDPKVKYSQKLIMQPDYYQAKIDGLKTSKKLKKTYSDNPAQLSAFCIEAYKKLTREEQRETLKDFDEKASICVVDGEIDVEKVFTEFGPTFVQQYTAMVILTETKHKKKLCDSLLDAENDSGEGDANQTSSENEDEEDDDGGEDEEAEVDEDKSKNNNNTSKKRKREHTSSSSSVSSKSKIKEKEKDHHDHDDDDGDDIKEGEKEEKSTASTTKKAAVSATVADVKPASVTQTTTTTKASQEEDDPFVDDLAGLDDDGEDADIAAQ